MSFTNKKILFLSAQFFQYEKAIVQQLEALGAEVDYFDERPSNSILTKGIIRVNPNFYTQKIKEYYHGILKQIQHKSYDYFLLIKGETVPISFIESFKSRFPNCCMIFYAYDAMSEYPKMHKISNYFDRKLTFEPTDALKYNFEFRPLFYLDSYKENGSPKEKKIDISFIGSAHTDRYELGEKIRKLAEDMSLKCYFYYYSPGRLAYYLKRIFDSNFKKFDVNKLNFKKLSHSEIQEIYNQSFAVLDINKPFQYGLTMRTFEALATSKKIITTNPDILKYPFYSPQNILFVNRKELHSLPKDFFQTGFLELGKEDLYKTSLKSWLFEVFFEIDLAYWSVVLKQTKV